MGRVRKVYRLGRGDEGRGNEGRGDVEERKELEVAILGVMALRGAG